MKHTKNRQAAFAALALLAAALPSAAQSGADSGQGFGWGEPAAGAPAPARPAVTQAAPAEAERAAPDSPADAARDAPAAEAQGRPPQAAQDAPAKADADGRDKAEHHIHLGFGAPAAMGSGGVVPAGTHSLGDYSPDFFGPAGLGVWAEVGSAFTGAEAAAFASVFAGPVYRFFGAGKFSLPVSAGVFADGALLRERAVVNAGAGALVQAEWRIGRALTAHVRALGAWTFANGGEFVLIPGAGLGFVPGAARPAGEAQAAERGSGAGE